MKLILLRSTCDFGRDCPNLNVTDRGTYVAQGNPVTGPDLGGHVLGPGEAVVEIPSSLLPELAAGEMAHGVVQRTGRGTILVRGRLVVDVEALRELNLPAGEAAVEIPISALPELELAHAQ